MNSTKAISLLAIILVAFSACKDKKKGNAVSFDANDANFNLTSALQQSSFSFEYISFKARAEATANGATNSFTANTRMKKDEIVWSSITVLLGIEGARIMIENDTVLVRDNLNRKVYESNLTYLEAYTNTPLNINQLQNLLVGNPVFADSLYKLIEVQGDTMLRVKANQGPISNELFIENKTFKLKTSILFDAISNQKLTINYNNFEAVNNTFLPQSVSLNTKQDGKDVIVNMEYENISLDSISSFPFSIPSKYEIIRNE